MSNLEDEFNAISGALRLGFEGEWEEARKYLDSNLPRNGFLNASLVLHILSEISMELAKIETQKVMEEYRK